MISNGSHRFSYQRTAMKVYWALLLLGFVVACIVLILEKPQEYLKSEVILMSIFLFLLFFFRLFCISTADIEVDDERISWVIGARRWRSLRWADISYIKIMPRYNVNRPRKLYVLYKENTPPYFRPWRSRPIYFDDGIHGVELLKTMVKFEVDKYNIRVEGSWI